MFFEPILNFIETKTYGQLFNFFWFFIVFELSRYIILDLATLLWYIFYRRFNWKSYKRARHSLFSERPLVSIISPGHNEGKNISQLIESLGRQTYRHFEVIVIDDGSTDHTPLICRDFLRHKKIQLFLRNVQRGGKASAANTGLRYARGKYIIHLDADSYLRSDALEQLLINFYINPRLGAVGGDIRVANSSDGICPTLQTLEYMRSLSVGRTVNSTLGILRIISGAYGAFRTDILRRLKGWAPGPGLDGDITIKIRKLGYEVAHEPYSVCYTHVPVTFARLAKQRYRWDRSLVRFRLRTHIDMLNPFQKNFKLSNCATLIENITYNVILNAKWWVYVTHQLLYNTEYIQFIFIVNLLLYATMSLFQLLFSILLYSTTIQKSEIASIVFFPLIPIYTGLFLRIVRTYAYLMECFHRASYYDKWNPWKVSAVVQKIDSDTKDSR